MAIEQGLREAQPLFGSKIINLGWGSWEMGEYKSADELVRSMPKNSSGQIDGDALEDKLIRLNQTWLEPGAIVLITSLDLYMKGTPWCFALSKRRTTVQSVHRFRGLSEKDESLCIRRTLKHELGHIYGCPANIRRSNTVENMGTHCTNPGCVMRQVSSVSSLIYAAKNENPYNCFCPQCSKDIMDYRRWCEAIDARRAMPLSSRPRSVASGGNTTKNSGL